MRKQSTIAALMFAAISCMMVANPGMPSKKKDKKAQVDSTAVAVATPSLSIPSAMKSSVRRPIPPRWTRCRRLYGNIIR